MIVNYRNKEYKIRVDPLDSTTITSIRVRRDTKHDFHWQRLSVTGKTAENIAKMNDLKLKS